MKKLLSNVTILKLMPGEVRRTEKYVTYTITHTDWICEWIVPRDTTMPIQRSCILKNIIDPLTDTELVMKLIPGFIEEIKATIKKWIQDGEIYADLLLKPENKPSFLTYAESII